MNSLRKHYLMLAVGLAVGVALGLVVSGTLDSPLSPGRESAAMRKSQTATEPRPRPDPKVVTVAGEQAQGFKIATVHLREFREERTAVGRIAFNDERTTSIFAPFQGRVLRLLAKPGDLIHPGSPLVVIDSPDLVQANAD